MIGAGQWSRQVGPSAACRCRCTRPSTCTSSPTPIPGVMPDLPVMRDPDGYIYFKEEVGGLVMGGFEPEAKPWGMDGIPEDFEFQLLPDDWDQFEILMENAMQRVPALETAQVKRSSTVPRASRRTTTSCSAPRPIVRASTWRGLQLDGHRLGGGAGQRARRMARRGRADRAISGPSTSAASPVQRQSGLAARPGQGDPRPALRHALAEPGTRLRARPLPSLAAL